MHQLKPNDGVLCKSLDEWTSVIRLAALNKIELGRLDNFDSNPYLFIYLDGCLESAAKKSRVLDLLKLHSFEDFTKKLECDHREEEVFATIKGSITSCECLSENKPKLLQCGCGDAIEVTIENMANLMPGKYKLVRVE